MTDTGAATGRFKTKPLLWAMIGAGLLLVLIAAAQGVRAKPSRGDQEVAVACQLLIVRQGEGGQKDGKFSAARSSCTPR